MKKKTSNLITIAEVVKLIKSRLGLSQLSEATLYRWIKTKGAPQALDFGIPRRWRRKEVEDWIQKQIDG